MKNYIKYKLGKLGYSNPDIIGNYEEPHRFYHSWDHPEFMSERTNTDGNVTGKMINLLLH